MAELIFWTVVAGVAVLAAACLGTWHAWRWKLRPTEQQEGGWVYFLSAPGQFDAPIKIGSTTRDPTEDRLPEIRTMSPFPLRVLWKFQAPDVHRAEREVHKQLADYRLHGEWFDRDATMALISHLKGEM